MEIRGRRFNTRNQEKIDTVISSYNVWPILSKELDESKMLIFKMLAQAYDRCGGGGK